MQSQDPAPRRTAVIISELQRQFDDTHAKSASRFAATAESMLCSMELLAMSRETLAICRRHLKRGADGLIRSEV